MYKFHITPVIPGKAMSWKIALLSAALTIITSAALSSSLDGTASAARASSNIIRSSRDYHLLEVVPHDKTSFT